MYRLDVYLNATLIHSESPIRDTVTLGRDPDCTVVIKDTSVSRHHASIELQRGRGKASLVIRDEGSTNGTFVNGRRIEEAEVRPEDSIRIGRCRIEIAQDGADLAAEFDDDHLQTVVFDGDPFADPSTSEKRLRAIQEMALGLSNLETGSVLRRAAETVNRCLEFHNLCFLLLRGSETLEEYCWNRKGPCRRDQVAVSRSIANSCVSSGRAIISQNTEKTADFLAGKSVALQGVSSALCVPLPSDSGAPLGIIYCSTCNWLKTYNRDDLQFLMLIAGQVATAIRYRRTIEKLKSAQLQLIQSEKLDSVGRLAAGIAHEVKNPLMTISTGIEYLLDFLPLPDEGVAQLLQDMGTAVNRADSVIRGLLDFSAPTKLELASADLNAIVEQTLVLVRHELTRLHISSTKDLADIPTLQLDTNKIQQVLLNLLINAIHAMPDGGELSVKTFSQQVKERPSGENGEILKAPQLRGTTVVAEIEDTGTGIPDDKIGKIFDPFFTTKPTGKGTGLGLSVVREIIEMHGGTISIANRESCGARVTLRFEVNEGVEDGEEEDTTR